MGAARAAADVKGIDSGEMWSRAHAYSDMRTVADGGFPSYAEAEAYLISIVGCRGRTGHGTVGLFPGRFLQFSIPASASGDFHYGDRVTRYVAVRQDGRIVLAPGDYGCYYDGVDLPSLVPFRVDPGLN